jgi:hypothetical protein
MPGKPPDEKAARPQQYSGTLLTNAIQVIIEMKAIEVPYRPPTGLEEESA